MLLHLHPVDRSSSSQSRLQCPQKLLLPVEYADSGVCHDLMSSEEHEVAADISDIHSEVLDRLACVDDVEGFRKDRSDDFADFPAIEHLSGHIRSMGYRHCFDVGSELGSEILKIDGIIRTDSDVSDFDSDILFEQKPRDDVRVMLIDGKQDLISLPKDLGSLEAQHEEIEGIRGIVGVADLMGGFGSDEFLHLLLRLLVELLRSL